ncbi:MAG: cytidylate kinase family protein [Lachnospiraceae bacterium]
MNITLTGNLGSGKSTICKLLKEENFEIVSGGALFRSIAAEKGMSVMELNQAVEEEIKSGNHSIDDLIDQRSEELGNRLDHAVFDSRLAWNFVKNSFKVFLIADINEATRRILHDNRSTEQYCSEEECRKTLLLRQKVEQSRFSELYHIDYYNLENYNLVLETSNVSPDVIKAVILDEFASYQRQEYQLKILLNPTSIFPTESIHTKKQSSMPEREVRVGIKNNEWYALQGHQTLLASLQQNLPFLQVGMEQKEAIPSVAQSVIDEFEELGHFTYKNYPTREQEENLLHCS